MGRLPALTSLGKLERLDVSRTRLTGACVRDLLKLAQLTRLDVRETLLTADDVRRLEAGLPKCQILHSVGAKKE